MVGGAEHSCRCPRGGESRERGSESCVFTRLTAPVEPAPRFVHLARASLCGSLLGAHVWGELCSDEPTQLVDGPGHVATVGASAAQGADVSGEMLSQPGVVQHYRTRGLLGSVA